MKTAGGGCASVSIFRGFGAGTDFVDQTERCLHATRPSNPPAHASLTGRLSRNRGRADPERLIRELGGDLDAIALNALEKDRSQR